MVMGNAFSSREAVSQIKVINLNEEPLMGFHVPLRGKSHLYACLAAVTELTALNSMTLNGL
jgi:hypothetical protein